MTRPLSAPGGEDGAPGPAGHARPLAATAAPRTRERSRRARAESWAWIFMRLSGVALLFLVLGHLFVIRVLAGLGEVNLAFVTVRWSGGGWRAYDLAMLLLAMAHGANGARGLVYDHVPRRARAWALWASYALCLAVAGLGTFVIVTFSRPL